MPEADLKQPKTTSRIRLPLFWKILGWFWLSTILIFTTMAFTAYINSGNIHYRPLPPPVAHDLERMTQRVDKMVNFPSRKNGIPRRRMQDLYLLNSASEDWMQREVPELLANLHTRVKRHRRPLVAFQKRQAYFGGTRLRIQGEQFWLYSKQTQPVMNRDLVKGFFRDSARLLLFTIFIISFPLSFLLSWALTRPIKRLQKATHELSDDLTARKSLQGLTNRGDEFGDLARDFDRMAKQVESMVNSQRQLVSDVSHELRSPLSRMQIALGLLSKNSEPAAQDNIERLQLEAQRMNQMLENLLTLSKLETQEVNGEPEAFDLCQLVRSVIDDGRFEAEQAGVTITCELPKTCAFTGFRESLISGIENILRNAIRYAGDQGKETGRVTVELVAEVQKIKLRIIDNGPGVPEQELERLFDAFYRPDFDRTRDTGGVGLGLSIARRAFQLNQGEISASNIKPHGLCVCVTFVARKE